MFVPEQKYMERALQLALKGAGHVSPNPMVGAVIAAPDGRIIGEGFHRRYGEAHAEVNAFASIREEDRHLIKESTIYVTLEPCSHYGKTPPCAKLLCDRGIARAVVGIGDPNPKVSGRGIAMLRDAGIDVVEDFMREECAAVNRRFLTAQTRPRPFIILKWAQSRDGFIALDDGTPISLSTPVTLPLMHRERALVDAITAGTDTILGDNPSLTTRLWPGNSPRPVIFTSPRLPKPGSEEAERIRLYGRDPILLDGSAPLEDNMRILREQHGISSLMVEGGTRMLQSFLDAGLYDEIRIETSPLSVGTGRPAPETTHAKKS